MSGKIIDWLSGDREPQTIYDLLGHPLLDPNRDTLLSTVQAANRELLPYQSHPDAAKADRAMHLLMELGRAQSILENPTKLQAYNEQVARDLGQEFVRGNGRDADACRRWLLRERSAHPDSVELVLKALPAAETAEVAVTADVPEPKAPRPKSRVFGPAESGSRSGIKPAPVQVEPDEDDYEVLPSEPEPAKPSKAVPEIRPVGETQGGPEKRRRKRKRAKKTRWWIMPAAVVGGLLFFTLGAILAVQLVLPKPGTTGQTPSVPAQPTDPPPERPDQPPDMAEGPKAAPPAEAAAVLYEDSPQTQAITVLAFAPDGRTVLSGGSDKAVRWWDVTGGKELHRFDGHPAAVKLLAFSRDGKRALSADAEANVYLWNLAEKRVANQYAGRIDLVTSMAFTGDGKRMLIGDQSGGLQLFDLEGHRRLQRFEGHVGPVTCLAISPDGRYVLSGGIDQTLRLWDLESGEQVKELRGHGAPVTAVAFSPGGRRALSGGGDNRVALWNLETGKAVQLPDPGTSPILAVSFLPEGRQAQWLDDKTVVRWDFESGMVRPLLLGLAQGLAVAPNGRLALSIDRISRPQVRRWELADDTQFGPGKQVAKVEPEAPQGKTTPPGKAGPVTQAPKKRPIPPADKQASAEKEIRKRFQRAFARKDDAQEALKLADNLRKLAADEKEEVVDRFVMLREACNLAAFVGNARVACTAIEELDQTFDIDALKMKADVLEAISKTTDSLRCKAVVEEALAVLDEVFAADKYALAQRLLEAAQTAAQKARAEARAGFLEKIKPLTQEVKDLQAEFAEVEKAEAILRKEPKDPIANRVVGKYCCLVKGDWDEGLLFLALGDDTALRALAEKERGMPQAANAQAELGNAWYKLAKESSGRTKERHLLLRAKFWYDQALPGLTDIDKARAQKRVEEIQKRTEAPARPKLAGAAPAPVVGGGSSALLIIEAKVRGSGELTITPAYSEWSGNRTTAKVLLKGIRQRELTAPTDFDNMRAIGTDELIGPNLKFSTAKIQFQRKGRIPVTMSVDGDRIVLSFTSTSVRHELFEVGLSIER